MHYKPKTHVTTKADRIRPNYAAIMGDLIRALAEEQGVSEEEYREMIQTPEGKEVFRIVCAWYGVPLFECRYRPTRKSLLRLGSLGTSGYGENGQASGRNRAKSVRGTLCDSMHP